MANMDIHLKTCIKRLRARPHSLDVHLALALLGKVHDYTQDIPSPTLQSAWGVVASRSLLKPTPEAQADEQATVVAVLLDWAVHGRNRVCVQGGS
jgi:hypothetical protein